jgi:hypothetical protein
MSLFTNDELKAFAYPEIVKQYNEENETEYTVEQCIPFIQTGDEWKEGIDKWIHGQIPESAREFLNIDYEEILYRQNRWDCDTMLFFERDTNNQYISIDPAKAIDKKDINKTCYICGYGPLMFYMRKGSVEL